MSPLRLPSEPRDPDTARAARYLQDNAAERRQDVAIGEPKISELEEHVPTWRVVGGEVRIYFRHRGERWLVRAVKD